MSWTNTDGSVTITGAAGRRGDIDDALLDLLRAGLTTSEIKRRGFPEGTILRHRKVLKAQGMVFDPYRNRRSQ